MDHPTESSRREFLKNSNAAISAGALVQFGLNSSVYASGDDTIKVGLVGCGGRGTGAATQALSTNGNVKLTAVGDAFENNAHNVLNGIKGGLKDKADRVQVPNEKIFTGFDAYQKVIDSGVDLVILATPP